MCVGGTLVQVRVGGDVCGRNTGAGEGGGDVCGRNAGAGEGGGRCVWVYEVGGSFLMLKLFYLRGGGGGLAFGALQG